MVTTMMLWVLTRTPGSKAAPVPLTSAPPWMKIQTGSPLSPSSPSEWAGVVTLRKRQSSLKGGGGENWLTGWGHGLPGVVASNTVCERTGAVGGVQRFAPAGELA